MRQRQIRGKISKETKRPGLLETAFGGGKVAGPEARKTTDEPEKIDELAIKYQRLMKEQNRNIADYGRYYNQALGEMDKMPQQGGTIYAPVARYQEQLIADWLQKASPAETEKYNSDPNFAQQKNWEIFNQAQQVQGEFYKRKAAEMAHNLVNKVDGGTPDEIQENLREAYFNKNNVYDINKVSNFLRMQGDENDKNVSVLSPFHTELLHAGNPERTEREIQRSYADSPRTQLGYERFDRQRSARATTNGG